MTTVPKIQLRGKWKVSSSHLLACQLKRMQIFKVHICFCSGRALKSPCPAYLLNSAVEPVAMCTLWSSHPVQKRPFCQTLWLLFETRFVKCWSINSNLKRQRQTLSLRYSNTMGNIFFRNYPWKCSSWTVVKISQEQPTSVCCSEQSIQNSRSSRNEISNKSKYSELRKNTPLRPSSVKS